jgi:hypothetical protein
MADEGPDYDTCCKLVGRLFLESQVTLERLNEKFQADIAALKYDVIAEKALHEQALKERDQVLGLLKAAQQERVVAP